MRKQMLKVLSRDMMSPINGEFQYQIGVDYHCPDFDDTDKECSRGFYGCDIDTLIYWFKAHQENRIFLCDVWGKSRIFETKQRWENIRLVRELTKNEIVKMCQSEETRLRCKLSEQPTDKDIYSLEQWIRVQDSVQDSVRDSGGSVQDLNWIYIL